VKLIWRRLPEDARIRNERRGPSSTHWIGYKVHFSETCDEELPRLITQVTTTIAPTQIAMRCQRRTPSREQRELLDERSSSSMRPRSRAL